MSEHTTLAVDLEIELEVSGTYSPAEPDVGIMADGFEDVEVEGIQVLGGYGCSAQRNKAQDMLAAVIKTPPRNTRKYVLELTRAEIESLIDPIPDWLRAHLRAKYESDMVEALYERIAE